MNRTEARSPLVSVVMTAYNHEAYIDAAISSVLGQTFSDFELIIVNDGSTDRTGERVRAHQDPRVVYIHQKNQGPSAAANTGIEAARGKYVALTSGDDLSLPDRLREQVETAAAMPGTVLFSHVEFVDDHGQLITHRHWASDFFNVPNRSRADWLRSFFFSGNALCAPSCFVETHTLREAGLLDRSLLQLQDFDLWIRLARKHPLHIIQRPLVGYRIRDDGQNLSSPSSAVQWRSQAELFLISNRFFEGLESSLMKEAFGADLIDRNFKEGLGRQAEEAFLFLNGSNSGLRLLGLQRIHALMNEPAREQALRETYGFEAKDLVKITGATQLFAEGPLPRRKRRLLSRKYLIRIARALYSKTARLRAPSSRSGQYSD